MVDENKTLAGKLDGDLQSAHRQMALIRAELSDTNKRISQFNSQSASAAAGSSTSSTNPTGHGATNHETSGSTSTTPNTNGTSNNSNASSAAVTTSSSMATSNNTGGTNGPNNPPTTNGMKEDRTLTQLNGVISNNSYGKCGSYVSLYKKLSLVLLHAKKV